MNRHLNQDMKQQTITSAIHAATWNKTRLHVFASKLCDTYSSRHCMCNFQDLSQAECPAIPVSRRQGLPLERMYLIRFILTF